MRFNSDPLKEAASVVQAELAGRGINAVIINTENGLNVEKEVFNKLNLAKLVLIFGSKDYGVDTGLLYCSFKELEFTLAKKKPFFLIKMCPKFENIFTFNRLSESIMSTQWNLGESMPVGLIDDIEKKFGNIVASTVVV